MALIYLCFLIQNPTCLLDSYVNTNSRMCRASSRLCSCEPFDIIPSKGARLYIIKNDLIALLVE